MARFPPSIIITPTHLNRVRIKLCNICSFSLLAALFSILSFFIERGKESRFRGCTCVYSATTHV